MGQHRRIPAFLLVAGLVLVPTLPAAPASKLTFFHWWTSPSESSALGALVKLFSEKYPDVTVVSAPAPPNGRGMALFPIIKRFAAAKQAPDAFQMHAGYASQVFFDGGLLAPIDDLWAMDKLEDVIPPMIRDMNKFEGHYYSVPVNVHRTNVIWYNKPLLDKHKIDPATLTTWDAFFKAAQALKAEGVPAPIQMGPLWTATHVFECILASLGPEAYEDWINGRMTASDDPRLVEAFQTFAKYLSLVNKDHNEIEWDKAIKRVMSGEGAFCTMGDWANGEFRFAGMKYGKDYGTILVPGTKGLYGLDVDTFQHPRGIAEPTNSARWLRLAASREGQDAFNPFKGSIPARTDADVTRYDPYQRTAIADLKTARTLYPSTGSAIPEVVNSRLNETMAAFMADQDVPKAAAGLASTISKLSAKYSRHWSLK
jgi:glucose/mannose transport system substrate-binding protein